MLSEWTELFLDGKFETDEQKALRESYEALKAQHEVVLMELGKKQLEVELLKKNVSSTGRHGNW